MKDEKFIKDTQTVLQFIQTFCDDKHASQHPKESLNISYREKNLLHVSFHLCSTCKQTFLYSLERLQSCPHEEKPRCRKCSNPCYERSRWKELAQIMRYSGMKLGLVKLKKIFMR
ncbi:MAG: nitrous oxide-stimulated promoter family protein [Sulfurospirillum sp.]|nr:nitrous oxide-stimulated promoter family protein [Sulfurospirillum sp.]